MSTQKWGIKPTAKITFFIPVYPERASLGPAVVFHSKLQNSLHISILHGKCEWGLKCQGCQTHPSPGNAASAGIRGSLPSWDSQSHIPALLFSAPKSTAVIAFKSKHSICSLSPQHSHPFSSQSQLLKRSSNQRLVEITREAPKYCEVL